eukprot:GFYU01000169.1.p1 GENE.GFYU01000169.1~~GFYU01000169.1.p1  ORF type:complete len:688 (+),score=282.21 GFYU01000169.1:209-2272(+)
MGLFNRKSKNVSEDAAALKIQNSWREKKTDGKKDGKKDSKSAPAKKHPLNGKLFCTEISQEMPIKVGKGEADGATPYTLVEGFKKCVDSNPNAIALVAKKEDEAHVPRKWTRQQYWDDTRMAARALLSLGLKRFDGVSILGFNSPEWFMADVAAVMAGGVACGIYSTNLPDACLYIIEHSNSTVVFVENEEQYAKVKKIRSKAPTLKTIVQWSGKVEKAEGVYSWEDFMALGKKTKEDELDAVIAKTKPGNVCTLIYTSGTTGNPKGVMLSNDNFTWTADRVTRAYGVGEGDRIVSYLPLSHIAAQMLDIAGATLAGVTVYFAKPDALRGSLVVTLRDVRPTVFLGVPRVWEKIEAKLKEVGRDVKGVAKSISTWAKAKGKVAVYRQSAGKSKPAFFGVANGLVFSKVKEKIGLDKCKIALTGAAPIAQETLDYFASLYIPIFEIYGMSECTGPQTFSLPTGFRLGSPGCAMPGTEMKIAETGEICYRGRHIMMGYLNNEEATAETIDEDGFLHSGDKGVIGEKSGTEPGFLRITGRIKELLITGGGENVAPVPIEDCIKALCPAISNVMIIGDKRKFLSAVVTLKTKPDADGPISDDLDAEALLVPGCAAKTVPEALKDEVMRKHVQDAIDTYNKDHSVSRAQNIAKWIFLPRDFSEEGKELTPTQKLKRRIVMDKYEKEIEAIYA